MRSSLFALCLLSSLAAANQRQRPTFMAPTTYERCQTITMFACGRIDAAGHRYGTAHERKECTRMTFHPDGTVVQRGDFEREDHGTYRIFAGKLRIAFEGQPAFELALSPDGMKLGDWSRKVTAR